MSRRHPSDRRGGVAQAAATSVPRVTRHPSLGASSHGTRSQPEPPPAEIHSPALRGPHDEATGLRDQRAGTGPARWRILIFATLCAVCLAVAGGYIALAAQRAGPFPGAATTGPPEAAGSAGISSSAQTLDAILAEPHVVFRSTALGDTYGKVMLAALDHPNGMRYATPLQCERVYFAAGQGLCLTADRGVFTTYRAILFDADFRPRHTFPLAGLPSRARLSPDGRYAAMTVFVSGHSYADGGFSTHTTIVETATGAQLGDLEQFTVLRDGAPIRSVDFNFWGITFARDSNRFYATLGTGGKTYLVEGDVAARQVRVLRDGVE
ncbi:MAG: hypothetical protein ACRDJN_02400, partial [Chloroflexota bacterium]